MAIESGAFRRTYEVQNWEEQKLTLQNIKLLNESEEPVIKLFNVFLQLYLGLNIKQNLG